MRPKRNHELWVRIRSNGLTQRDFSRLVGISEVTISSIINGRYLPGEEHQRRIARALNCKISDIFEA